MGANDLVTQGANASAMMILTMLNRSNMFPKRYWLNMCESTTHTITINVTLKTWGLDY